ncbi:membrane protein, partial [Salmonella enterica subsp. enterica serovar Weltevreden]
MFRYLCNQKAALLTAILLMAAGVLTLCFPESWYPQETEWQLTAEKEITGIHGGLSGLTWNPDSRTLFAVTDHPSSVVELDTEGNVLRVIPSDGDHDFEHRYLGGNRTMPSSPGSGERTLTTTALTA